ncbi:Valine--tRNA ligase [Bienertia sinuspersici]
MRSRIGKKNKLRRRSHSKIGGRSWTPPDYGMFDNSSVTRLITGVIHAYCNRPWQNYSQVDQPTRDQWFNMWKHDFRWKPELKQAVRDGFDRKAADRLKDIHYDTTVRRGGRPFKWMPKDVHEAMMANAQKEDFQERSLKAKKNRRGGDLDNTVPPSHCQGSISAADRARRLVTLTIVGSTEGGVMPLAADVYCETHFKNVPGKGLVPISEKASQIKRRADELREQVYMQRECAWSCSKVGGIYMQMSWLQRVYIESSENKKQNKESHQGATRARPPPARALWFCSVRARWVFVSSPVLAPTFDQCLTVL